MAQTKPTYKTRDDTRGQSLSDYWPLVSLIMVSALSALALNYGETAGLMAFMHYFMGFFLCSFAMLKLFNPDAFADGFEMYDVIAKRWRHYLLERCRWWWGHTRCCKRMLCFPIWGWSLLMSNIDLA